MSGKKANHEKLVTKLLTFLQSMDKIKEKETALLAELVRDTGSKELIAAEATLAECQIVSIIRQSPTINTTSLAKAARMTKGGVSKLTARMAQKKLINITHPADNKKEINYEATSLGNELGLLGEELLRREARKLGRLFADYGTKKLNANIEFLQGLQNYFCKAKM